MTNESVPLIKQAGSRKEQSEDYASGEGKARANGGGTKQETAGNIPAESEGTAASTALDQTETSTVTFREQRASSVSEKLLRSLRQTSRSISFHFSDLQQSYMSLPDIPSIDRRSSTFMAAINLQSMVLGTSVLSFPFAFSVAGIYAVILTIFIGGLTSYTAAILEECLYEESKTVIGFRKRVRCSFVDMCKAVYPRTGQYLMEAMVYISLARNVVVLVLLTDLTQELARSTVPNVDQGIWTCMWAVGVMPFLIINRVSILAWVSLIGLILYLLALVAMLVTLSVVDPSWSVNNLLLSVGFDDIGLAIGIIINSYSQHLTFPSLEGSMKYPSQYRATIHTSFFINILVKIGFGLIGVLNFGLHTEQSITGNLPPISSISVPIRLSIMFFTYFTIPIQSFVIFELIDIKFLPYFPIFQRDDEKGNLCWLILSRAVLITCCCLISVLVPDFGVIVSLIGSIRGTIICLIFPPLFYYKLCYNRLSWFQRCFSILVIILGVLFGCWGAYASGKALFFK